MFQIREDVEVNGKIVEVSTVDLSMPEVGIRNKGFETCLFFENGESEVVEWYATQREAREGHEAWIRVDVIRYVMSSLRSQRQLNNVIEGEPLAEWEKELLAQTNWQGGK
jgi:hypothetical protein